MRVLRRGLTIAPQSALLRGDLAWRAMDLNLPGEVIATLEPIFDSYGPGTYRFDSVLTGLLTEAYHMLGNYERELEYARFELEHFPDESYSYFGLVRALAGMGRIEAVKEVVDDYLSAQAPGWTPGRLMTAAARELQAHGHPREAHAMAARSVEWYEDHPQESSFERRLFATALWMVGRLDDAEALVSQWSGADPGDSSMAAFRGMLAAENGDVDRARKISENLPVADNTRDAALRIYRQAAIAAQLGEKDRSVALLAEALSQGFQFEVHVHQVVYFEPLWDYPPFQELIKPKG
jgi:tetratricopeptide (TPR) repeat protein